MASGTGHVLLVAANAGLATLTQGAAKAASCLVTVAGDVDAAGKLAAKRQFDLILIDGPAFEAGAIDRFLELPLAAHGKVVLVGHAVPGRYRARTDATVEYIPESMSLETLARLMDSARFRTPSQEIMANGDFSGMIGRTPRMQALFATIRRVAPLDVGVLVQGESGTGKELVARALHALSGRTGKFVAVNCGAVAPELLASQIFGHERGAFTGATQSHAGYFEQANGGTLFLDEITEMPLPLQVYLLRVIETHALTRVGGAREIPVDARIVAASNRDLRRAAAAGNLRQDLYYRLLEFPLTVPPLRERRDDVSPLVQHFLGLLNNRYGTSVCISEQALQQFELRTWFGNVRELRHVIQRLYILAGDTGEIDHLPAPEPAMRRRASDPCMANNGWVPGHAFDETPDGMVFHFNIGMTLDEIERIAVLKTLVHCCNNKREVARILGISLKTVYNKLLRYRALGLVGDDALDEPRGDVGNLAKHWLHGASESHR